MAFYVDPHKKKNIQDLRLNSQMFFILKNG